MKKILLMLLFSFSVIAYAAPPPAVTDVIADQVQYVVQDEVQTINATAPEVAYVYTGNTLLFNEAPQFAEVSVGSDVPPMPVFTINYSACSFECDLPPLLRTWHVANYNYNRDLQFTNYGYPLSMN